MLNRNLSLNISKTILFILGIYFVNPVLSQELTKDSITSIFEKMWVIKKTEPGKVDSIYLYTDSLIKHNNQISEKYYLSNRYARIKLYQGRISEARKILKNNIYYAQIKKDAQLLSSCYREMGETYQFQSKDDSAFYYLNSAITLTTALSINFWSAYRIKSQVYIKRGEYEKALRITTSIINNIPDVSNNFEYENCKSVCLVKTCIIYRELQLYDLCEKWCKAFLKHTRKKPFTYHSSQSWFQMGYLLSKLKKYDKAIIFFQKALDISEKLNNTGMSSNIRLQIANNYLELYNESAAKQQFDSVNFSLPNSKWVKKPQLRMMGTYLIKQKKFKQAELYLLPFTQKSYYKNNHPSFQAKVLKDLADLYAGLEEYEKANYYLKEFNKMDKYLNNKLTYYNIAKMEQVQFHPKVNEEPVQKDFALIINIILSIIGFLGGTSILFLVYKKSLFFAQKKSENDEIEKSLIPFKEKQSPSFDFNPIIKQLDSVVEQKVLSDSSISLNKLSDKIKFPTYQISIVLNEHYKMNFFDFVNSTRVKHAIEIMKSEEGRKLSMEGIGFSSGFKSRASFYRAFKKFTNKTPKDFFES